VNWSGSTLAFSISVGSGARNLQAMVPFLAASGSLQTLTRNGSPVSFTTEVIKGINYAQFPAAVGNYAAVYGTDTTPPVISAVSATATSTTATVVWTTNELSNSRVDYGTSPTALTLNASVGTLVTSHTVPLSGLSPTTTYYYRVTSADGINNSATSPNPPASPLSFTTPVTPPNTPPVAVAAGVPSSGFAPLAVNFSGAASTDANGDSLTYAWTFGDGGTATGRLTSHTYNSAGAYAAILTVNDGRGGSDTASVAVSVTPAPAGFPQNAVLDNFNRANGSVGSTNWVDEPTQFTITSNVVGPVNGGDHYIEWNGAVFGADQEVYVTISTASPTAIEQNLMLKTQGTIWSAGHIEVSYNAASSRVFVYTFTPPSTWQTAGQINGVTYAAGDRFGARALSNGTVQVYRNTTLLGTVPVSAYATLGGRIGLSTGQASAARYDDFGGGNYATAPANVAPVAVAAGVPSSGTAPHSVNFSGAASTDANGDSLTYAWTFGDGGTATGRLTSHTYTTAGAYAAILTVNDGRGGTDTASVAVSVTPPVTNLPPVAVAAGVPSSGTAPLAVNFSGAASTDANGDSLTYAWTFGDGGTATGRLTSHTYATPGAYAAILTVNDGRGGTDTASVAISALAPNVAPVAVAAGVPTSGNAPLLVNFSGAASTDANGDSLTYAWTFGDGGTATGRLTSHTYASGNYAVILTVNDGRGGTDTASVAISVTNLAPVAVAAGVPTSGNAPLLVNFSGAASTDANGDSLAYAWTFGDGGTATGRLTSHTYNAAGAFAVILTVTDGRGGSDTASVAVSVTTPPNGFPQTAILDNFNRANGGVGSNWVDEPTQFTITSNVVGASNNNDHYIEWNGATFGANQEAYVTISTASPTAIEQNLMLKTQGTTWLAGHIEVSYNAPGSRVFVYTFTPPSTWQTFGTLNGVTYAAGDRFGARALSNGTVQVYRNTTLVGTVTVSTYAALGGRIGLSVGKASAARYDDFGGGTVNVAALAPAGPATPATGRVTRPSELSLASPYPNPTTGAVQLELSLPTEQTVRFSVLDTQGREVWSTGARDYAAGRWTLQWPGRTAQGPASPGVYLLRVGIGQQVLMRRVAMIR
jgi:PKD repeat protein